MNLDRLSVNQMTVKQLSLPDLVAHCVRLGIGHVGLWREPVAEYGVQAAADLVREAGLTVTTLCRGGFFTSDGWLDENRAAIDEAVTLGTDTLVLVSGGLTPACPDLPSARARITEAIGTLAPYAGERGVRLAVEPLHPMYAADRCAVSTLDQALEIAEHFPAEQVGVVVDTYHLWWDDRAPAAVERAGATGRLHSFQLADWTTPLPAGVLNGRGQLGDGSIDLRAWSDLAERAGWTGPVEVELFNDTLWARDGVEVLEETLGRFLAI
ncbi:MULTISPECIES: sugar phosphate isomerase/epimerase family protein [unclassified Streptomyces]|uniref:sugar phosphate isomerase/epimerase family protein n=1 Tax=unclassified Streptomyces TaxID=2593676 RepID=UPI00166104F5|nr:MULTISPECIES: sugar phosphate isomerase/epimerase family protein [unclassified Streptomyces]MBD0709793.1 sugar phosphate isomerase [Streptomyces sp. CBMA291]MBD0717690.1 sugar phosphate isomerase [Streptomyces sp. CBMA370]